MKQEMNRKRVLITGGTSGLGRELALQFARSGAQVAIVARNSEGLQKTIQDALPHRITAIQGDVASKEDTYRIAGQAGAHLGGIDLLINNASTLGVTPLRSLLNTECEDLAEVFETNLIGAFRLTKAVLPGMLLQGSGTILNISSDAAVNPYPLWGAYGASKAALAHLSRIWGEELKETGVRFFAIDPGDMDTPMHAAAIPDADPSTLARPRDAALRLIQLTS